MRGDQRLSDSPATLGALAKKVQVDHDDPAKDDLGKEVQDAVQNGLSGDCGVVGALTEAPHDGVSNPAYGRAHSRGGCS